MSYEAVRPCGSSPVVVAVQAVVVVLEWPAQQVRALRAAQFPGEVSGARGNVCHGAGRLALHTRLRA